MVDSTFLRLLAARLRDMKQKLLSGGMPDRTTQAEFEALAREFDQWSNDIDGVARPNGGAQLC